MKNECKFIMKMTQNTPISYANEWISTLLCWKKSKFTLASTENKKSQFLMKQRVDVAK
jgi:hypothetical protein